MNEKDIWKDIEGLGLTSLGGSVEKHSSAWRCVRAPNHPAEVNKNGYMDLHAKPLLMAMLEVAARVGSYGE